jgi:hypothetical protein
MKMESRILFPFMKRNVDLSTKKKQKGEGVEIDRLKTKHLVSTKSTGENSSTNQKMRSILLSLFSSFDLAERCAPYSSIASCNATHTALH